VKRALLRIAERIDAASLRERALMFAAAAALVVVVLNAFLLDAEFTKGRALAREIAQLQAEGAALRAQSMKLLELQTADPDREKRATRERLKGRVSELEAQISAEQRKLTDPAAMGAVIEEMLARHRKVRLEALRTLATESVGDARQGETAPAPQRPLAAKPAAKAAERQIFRHGIELTVSGAYLDLLGYLRDLERLPTQLYWGTLDLNADAYPKVVMKVTVYTLSLDRAWMNV